MVDNSVNGHLSARLLISWDYKNNEAQPEIQIGGAGVWYSTSGMDWLWADGYIANRDELTGQADLLAGPDDRPFFYSLFRRSGAGAAKFIAGTFAWVLWDQRDRALWMARDHIGNYNFYYTYLNGKFWVANHAELLLGLQVLPKTLNPRSIIAQITNRAPLAGETFYEAIRELEPAGWVRLQAGKLQIGRYWQVQPRPQLKLSSDEEYAQILRDLLQHVIAQHAPGGQVGVTLSSGLDSTSVAATLRQAAPETRLTALCWTAPELPEADEGKFSIEVCRFLNIPWVQIRADLNWPMKSSEGICTDVSTPYYNIYTDPWTETFQTAKDLDMEVVFSGISGDNLFGGNVFAYPDLLLTGRWLELIRQVRFHLPRSMMGLSLYQIVRRMILSPIRQAYLPGWGASAAPPAPWLRPPYDELYRQHFTQPPETQWMLPGRLERYRMLSHPSLPRIVEGMNRHADRFGVEMRHPLVDHRLIEFALSLPTTQTFRASQRKIILRNAMSGLLPSAVLEMWDKIYPSAICDRGLRDREPAKIWPLMTNMRAAEMGFVDEVKLRQAYQDYLDGKTDKTLFWHTLTLEDWLRRWF